jgi:hypothetical protein
MQILSQAQGIFLIGASLYAIDLHKTTQDKKTTLSKEPWSFHVTQ